jgi:DNA-directed RNA polymerase specialized sigma24 family protein
MNERIIEEWLPYAKKVATRDAWTSHLREDFVSIAMETLCKVSDALEDKTNPKAFLARSIDGRIYSFLYKERRCKNVPEDIHPKAYFFNELKVDIPFTEQERKIISLKLEGCSIQKCADELELSYGTVWRILQVIKRKLEQ